MDWDLICKNFNRRGYSAYVCANEEEVKDLLLKEVLKGKVEAAAFGNSQTCRELGLVSFVGGKAGQVFIHDPENYSPENDHKAQWADIYFTSANGVSKDGHIVNIDGTGNRVSATCYGPKHVVYIIGQNKLADNLHDAINRARQAAVSNAKRLKRRTPCAVSGKCMDCLSPECICGVMSIHRKALIGNKITVVFVKQNLGL